MKLRIRGDSVRLRLKRSEVARLAAGEAVLERTRFPANVLTCRLEVGEGPSASYANGTILVVLPESAVQKWAGSADVSIVESLPASEDATLSLLVEKDFACLEPGQHRDCEDDEDTFPHPARRTTQ